MEDKGLAQTVAPADIECGCAAGTPTPAKDRPIIFSGPMVQALLAGRKTQTCRLTSSPLARCKVGDRLWVREKHWGVERLAANNTCPHLLYDDEWINGFPDESAPLRPCGLSYGPHPSIHMHRWASRLTLAVTNVRRMSLQGITYEDIWSEGAVCPIHGERKHTACSGLGTAWRDLWDSLHTKPGETWADNPEVVALSFTVERRNIDEARPAPADGNSLGIPKTSSSLPSQEVES